MLFWTSALASTIPIPSGLFIPVLKMGAAYGRLLGELMHEFFPDGIKYGKYVHSASIVPGSYAVVGAAAFSGAVTHTISTSVILFEMTGQIVHIIPVILGVLIANAVCQSLQPSIYDSIIEIKKLPYLPPIASSNSVSHKILVRDFMNRYFAYVWKKNCTYQDIKTLLATHKKLISFPLVECPKSMKLLGSVPRSDLLKMLYLHLGRERRLQEVYRRNSDTNSPTLHVMNAIRGRLADELRITAVNAVSQRKFSEPDRVESLSSSDSDSSSSSSSSASPRSSSPPSPVPPAAPNDVSTIQVASSKLILESIPAIGYGSTSRKSTIDLSIDFGGNSSGLDREEIQVCQVEDDDQKVAKIINHYDHGSLNDEMELSKSIKDIESDIEASNRATEVVVSLNPSRGMPDIRIQHSERVDTPMPRPAESPFGLKRALSPLVECKPSFNFSNTGSGTGLPPPSPSLSSRPTKSILKTSSTSTSLSNMYKRNISVHSFNSSFGGSQYEPGGSKNLGILSNRHSSTAQHPQKLSIMMGDDTSPFDLSPIRRRRKVRLPRLRVVDMTPEEQEQWEKEQLSANIDISVCQIDEAPFQLVEQTSLYRVHTLFSMLGLNHAHVTSFGRLVGIVALKDIRIAIEKMLQE